MELISGCKHLKNCFGGNFPADFPCSSKLKNKNTFMIMNTSPSDQPGTHWLLFAQAGGQIFFEDPICKRLYDYPLGYKSMRRTIHKGNQLLTRRCSSLHSLGTPLACVVTFLLKQESKKKQYLKLEFLLHNKIYKRSVLINLHTIIPT